MTPNVKHYTIGGGWTQWIEDKSFLKKLKNYCGEFKPLIDSVYTILNDSMPDEIIINFRDDTAYIWKSDKKISDKDVNALITKVMKK